MSLQRSWASDTTADPRASSSWATHQLTVSAPEPAVLRRHGHPEEVELGHALVEIPRELVGAVDLGRARPDLALGELAAQVADLALGLA